VDTSTAGTPSHEAGGGTGTEKGDDGAADPEGALVDEGAAPSSLPGEPEPDEQALSASRPSPANSVAERLIR
jgi:hypothetical protein